MQLGDETARERLIKANLGFVVHVAKEYAGYGLTHMELISEGNMGLIEATYRFDEKKGYRFVSYAVWWIKNFILSTLAQHSRTIRVPDNRISQLGKISKILKQYEEENPLNHLEEITRELETTPKSIEELLISTQEVESLDKPNGNGEIMMIKVYTTQHQTQPKDRQKRQR